MSDYNEIAAALAKFQGEMPTVAKEKRATVAAKNGPSYSYTYADLADVSAAAMPLLAKHGLAFTATPERNDAGGYEVVGRLLHTSGQHIEGRLPMQTGQAQQMGGWLSYARRYLLGCLTGIVTEDDEDGRVAGSRAESEQQPEQSPVKRMSRKRPEPSDSDDKVTEKQLGMMLALFDKAGNKDRERRLAYCRNLIGRDIESSKDLTKREASKVIDALNEDVSEAPNDMEEDTR